MATVRYAARQHRGISGVVTAPLAMCKTPLTRRLVEEPRRAGTPPRPSEGGRKATRPTAPLAAGLLPLVAEHPASSRVHEGKGSSGDGERHIPSARPGGVLGSAGSSNCPRRAGQGARHSHLCRSQPLPAPSRVRFVTPWVETRRWLAPRGPRPRGEAPQQAVPSLCCCLKQKLN